MHRPTTVDPSRGQFEASRVAPRVLAGLRIFLGIIFLIAVYPKLKAGSGFAPMMSGFLQHQTLTAGHPFYQRFVTSVVLPHVGLFAGLVMAGELFAGLALLTGVVTRLAALVAMTLLLNYMWAKGAWFWVPSSNDAAFFAIALALLVGRGGRTWGVDRGLAARWPEVPLW